jgi:hypothetical protein
MMRESLSNEVNICLLDNLFAVAVVSYISETIHTLTVYASSFIGSSSVDTPDSRKSAEEFITEMTGLITVCKVEDAFATGL